MKPALCLCGHSEKEHYKSGPCSGTIAAHIETDSNGESLDVMETCECRRYSSCFAKR